MQLFIMRHGQANPHGDNDSHRELTEDGFLEAQKMARWINRSNISFTQVFVSPYIRAQQTAKTLTSELNCKPSIKTLNFITPSGNAQQIHDYIDGLSGIDKTDNILFVSHMPVVSYLVAELTADSQAPIFQTAAIAHIDYDTEKMKGELVKLTSPFDLA